MTKVDYFAQLFKNILTPGLVPVNCFLKNGRRAGKLDASACYLSGPDS